MAASIGVAGSLDGSILDVHICASVFGPLILKHGSWTFLVRQKSQAKSSEVKTHFYCQQIRLLNTLLWRRRHWTQRRFPLAPYSLFPFSIFFLFLLVLLSISHRYKIIPFLCMEPLHSKEPSHCLACEQVTLWRTVGVVAMNGKTILLNNSCG